jgi:hypothetical protein
MSVVRHNRNDQLEHSIVVYCDDDVEYICLRCRRRRSTVAVAIMIGIKISASSSEGTSVA